LSVLGLLEYAFDLVPMDYPELAGLTWLAATIIAIRAWVFMRREKAADAVTARADAGLPIAAVVTLFSRLGKYLGPPGAGLGLLLGFPVLRLRGDYLAIVTLGFGEMIRLVLLNGPDFGLLANGAKGIGDIPRPSFFGMEFTAAPKPGAVAFSDYFGLDFSP